MQSTISKLTLVGMMLAYTGCAVSPETQAKMDAYEASIPMCNSTAECDRDWQVARNWAIEHADFPILTESEDRIMASSTLSTNSGVGVVVTRESVGSAYRVLVDVECLSAYGCPDIWDMKLDFNQAVGGTGPR